MTDILFSDAEFAIRHRKLQDTTKEIDVCFIFARPDLFYYSGCGLDGVIQINEEAMIRYVRRNLELAGEHSVLDTKTMDSFRIFKNLGKTLQPKTLGLELDILPYRTVDYISKALGNPELVDIGGTLREIRAIKSKEELKFMKQACKLNDSSFEYAREIVKPGKTEIEISAKLEAFLRSEGHPGWVQVRTFQHNLVTNAYVMAGESTATLNSMFGPVSGQGFAKMHMVGPSRRKIQDGDAVLIDTTAVSEGYISDVTRTFMVGSVENKILEAHHVAEEVQNECEKLLKPRNHCDEIYRNLSTLVKEMGYEMEFMGSKHDKVAFIGHGVGLELDELPIITEGYKRPLQIGNTIAVEPKLILQQPKTGVGIEDTWLVTENGGERLSQFPYAMKV